MKGLWIEAVDNIILSLVFDQHRFTFYLLFNLVFIFDFLKMDGWLEGGMDGRTERKIYRFTFMN